MKRRRCFTLVELLVVIAIIGLLIAILLPVVQRAWRRFVVLACPIAYVGEGYRLHLTDPQGKYDVSFDQLQGVGGTLAWSPSGRRIGFFGADSAPAGKPIQSFVGVVDPMSGQVVMRGKKYEGGFFACWTDDGHFFEASLSKAYLWDVETGQVIRQFTVEPFSLDLGTLSGPLPPQCAPLAFVATRYVSRGKAIVLLRKDLSEARQLPYLASGAVRVDPLGEWIAWDTGDGQGGHRIALKRLNEPAATPPTLFGGEFRYPLLCDWTDDGNLLIAAGEDGQHCGLYLYNKDGKMIRQIPTPVRVLGFPASYRKYGHR
ncbi:MAG: prepilin-type N-terminal cleavage/methylation domain-containing protein [Bacillota bacterium]